MRVLERNAKGQIVGTVSFCICGKRKEKRRAMCVSCRTDPVQRGKNLWKMQVARHKRNVERLAEQETAGLPQGEPMVPVLLNRLIDEWMRQ